MFVGRLLLDMFWISWGFVCECVWEENLVFVLNVWEGELEFVFEGVLFFFGEVVVLGGSGGKD